jgi:phosphatidate cytidylyltransferase
MLLKRVVVAFIAIPLIYLCLTELPPIYFLALLAVVSALAQYEFHAMYKTSGILSVLGITGGIVLLASSYFAAATGAWDSALTALVVIVIIITSARLFIKREPTSALRDIAPPVIGIVYIPLLLIPMWYLRLDGYEWIILLLLSVWSADTFAYFIGKKFGKRRLYKEISPNKTVAGAVGSVAGGIIASMLSGALLIKELGMPALFLVGAALGTITIVGDLVESMFKRDADIKDSGNLIPGHGGVLDRIDSILFAAPTLYILRMLL